MKKFFLVIFLVAFLAWIGFRVYHVVDFNLNCQNYLKLAADANTVEMAKPQLDKAISYLENHNLTSGIVSIFLKNPKNDIGFFYQNLKACQTELERVSPNASQLEESNVLMKLRESLLDEGQTTEVTHPFGISIYPYNVVYFIWLMISFVGTVIIGIRWFKEEYC